MKRCNLATLIFASLLLASLLLASLLFGYAVIWLRRYLPAAIDSFAVS